MKPARPIRKFIERELLTEDVDGDPLTAGALDSLALEQLIAFIEERFEILFEEEELVAENFGSIDILAGLVEHKRRTARAAR